MSSRYKLDEHISVAVPTEMSVTFQAFPDFGLDMPVLCLWEQEQLQCLLSVDEQPNGMAEEDYWQSLDAELQANILGVKRVKEGRYTSLYHDEISYRIYRDPAGGFASTQIYHLIQAHNKTYWVIAALYHYEELFITNAQIIQLLKTALIENTLPTH